MVKRQIKATSCAGAGQAKAARIKGTNLVGPGQAFVLAMVLVASAVPSSARQAEPALAQPGGENQALSARYRFQEKYIVVDNPAQPEQLSQYEVATRETAKITRERPQGAPEFDQTELKSIYTERVAKINKDGTVGELVRRYDTVKLKSTVEFTKYKTPYLEGLTVLYRLQNRMSPQILSLTDRQLRQREYEQISYQAFLPSVSYVLPRRPSRVGDSWPVTRPALRALIGESPFDEDLQVTAELREIRNDPSGKGMTAVIDVKGEFQLEEGPSAVNAQLHFRFQPSRPSGAGASTKAETTKDERAGSRADAAYDARGFITKVLMAQSITMAMPGSDGRLKQTIDRSLVLERRTLAEDPKAKQIPELPSPSPAPTVQNAWLLYDDPLQRFHLLFPQEFRVKKVYPEGGIDLVDPRPDGTDVIQVNLVPKGPDAPRDRLPADPLQEKRLLEQDWKKSGEKVLPGSSDWLQDPEWSRLKRKVYRIEAALVPDQEGSQGPAPASGRIYLDRYIVQFTTRNDVVRVTAMTTRDPHVPFRDAVESAIKNFEFGPSEGVLPISRATGPADPGAAPSAP
jgi:hypothetical protein